jgi:hypothetical protein
LFSLNCAGQIKIVKPVDIPLTGQFDSTRLAASKFCFGNIIIKSEANFDLRIYRFMAFGDYKIMRISTHDKYNLRIDIYSLNFGRDSLISHKYFKNTGTGQKIKNLVIKYDILNLPNLDSDYLLTNSLPIANDGNIYEVEAKVGNRFTYKVFDNPEIYSEYFPDKAQQATDFVNFIKELQKLFNIKISDPEL